MPEGHEGRGTYFRLGVKKCFLEAGAFCTETWLGRIGGETEHGRWFENLNE